MNAELSPASAASIRAVMFLMECGYTDVKPLKGGKWACINRLLFTTAILTGSDATVEDTYERRWCYHTYEDAQRALDAWDGTGEPEGWHRDPITGRRRPDGDPAREYIMG